MRRRRQGCTVVTFGLAAGAGREPADIAVAVIGRGSRFEVSFDALVDAHVLAAEVAHTWVSSVQLELALARSGADLVTAILAGAGLIAHTELTQSALIAIKAGTGTVKAQPVAVAVVDTRDNVTCRSIEAIEASTLCPPERCRVGIFQTVSTEFATALVASLVGGAHGDLAGGSTPCRIAVADAVLAVTVGTTASIIPDLEHHQLLRREVTCGFWNRAGGSAGGDVTALSGPAGRTFAEGESAGAFGLLADSVVVAHTGAHVDRTISSAVFGRAGAHSLDTGSVSRTIVLTLVGKGAVITEPFGHAEALSDGGVADSLLRTIVGARVGGAVVTRKSLSAVAYTGGGVALSSTIVKVAVAGTKLKLARLTEASSLAHADSVLAESRIRAVVFASGDGAVLAHEALDTVADSVETRSVSGTFLGLSRALLHLASETLPPAVTDTGSASETAAFAVTVVQARLGGAVWLLVVVTGGHHVTGTDTGGVVALSVARAIVGAGQHLARLTASPLLADTCSVGAQAEAAAVRGAVLQVARIAAPPAGAVALAEHLVAEAVAGAAVGAA